MVEVDLRRRLRRRTSPTSARRSRKGIEKVISTIGIHEVRGYARQFSSIGVRPELAEIFQTRGVRRLGGRRRRLRRRSTPTPTSASRILRRRRGGEARRRRSASTPRSTRRRSRRPTARPRYEDYSEKVRELEAREPDLDAPHHRPPVRSRADRARAGGRRGRPPRLPDRDLLDELRLAVRARLPRLRRGREARSTSSASTARAARSRTCTASYRKWRGQQVASGRFGVSAEMLNSSYLAEIKIGQGAKPGEGGHLPGKKVSEKVAAARNASPGHRPDLALEQPRPLLDRGPRRADRRAEDGEPGPARLGEGPGGAEHRHDRPRDRQGRAPTSSPCRASRAAPAPRASTPCATSACRRTSAPAPSTGR